MRKDITILESSSGNSEIVLYNSRIKLSFLAIGALAFVIAGVAIVLNGLQSGGGEAIVFCFAGVVSIAFFGWCLLFALKRVFASDPALVINSEGLFDNTSAIAAGFVPWNEIATVFQATSGRQRFLCIVPRDIEGFLSRQPPGKQRWMRANLRMVDAPIAISANTLPISLDQLYEEITAHLS